MRTTALLAAGVALAMSGCVSMPLSPAEEVTASLAPLSRPELSLNRVPGKPPVAMNLAAIGPNAEGEVFEGGEVNEIISQFSGPPPKLELVSPSRRDGLSTKEPDAQSEQNRIGPVHYHLSASEVMNLGKATLDGVFMVMPYPNRFGNDSGQRTPSNDSGQYIEQVVAALKPGAVLLVVDEQASPGLGRSDKQAATAGERPSKVDEFKAHGLDFIGSIPAESHPDATRADQAPESKAGGKTNRVFELFRKPEPVPIPAPVPDAGVPSSQ